MQRVWPMLFLMAWVVYGAFGVFPKDIWEIIFTKHISLVDAIPLIFRLNSSFNIFSKSLLTRFAYRRCAKEISLIQPEKIIAPGLGFIRGFCFRRNKRDLVLLQAQTSNKYYSVLFYNMRNSSVTSSFHLPETERFLDLCTSKKSSTELILVPAFFKSTILIFNHNGKQVGGFGEYGLADHQMSGPRYIYCTSEDHVIVTSRYVQIWTLDGTLIRVFGTYGELLLPTAGVPLDTCHSIITCDFSTRKVTVFDNEHASKSSTSGRMLRQWSHASFITPTALEVPNKPR